MVRYIGENRFQIEALEKWRQEVLAKGCVIFGTYWFSVFSDLSILSSHTDHVQVWLRITNIDYDMRGRQGLEVVIKLLVLWLMWIITLGFEPIYDGLGF